MASSVAADMLNDDRRRLVNSGIRRGRDVEIANGRAFVEIGGEKLTSTVIAIRGGRLALCRSSLLGQGQESEAFRIEFLSVVETDADERLAAHLAFDLDDFDAALAELDARYLAGEAARYARTWSAITGSYAAISRHEIPALTPDCVTVDHRPATAFGPGELSPFIRAAWGVTHDIRTYVEIVHRLSDSGAVCSYAAHGISHDGFEAEWHEVAITTVDGDMVNRSELFDEADLDAALARFDQLSRPVLRLENAASQAIERYFAHVIARDWEAFAAVMADDFCTDDRRRVINAGIRHGRDAEVANLQAAVDAGFTNQKSVVIAVRGERLTLTRISGCDAGSGEFVIDVLTVVEVNSANEIAAIVAFDPDDVDAAIAQLDARYLAGETAAHAHTWSAVLRAFDAFNGHELPATTPDWVNVDHRRGRGFPPGELVPYIRAAWELAPQAKIYVEAVHRLSDLGAVVTQVLRGTSPGGFDAEWLEVNLLTVEGDLINRSELFDEDDLDAALAHFDELSLQTRRLENAATRAYERLQGYFAAREWAAITEMLSDDHTSDDRRAVVGGGVQHGRAALIENLRATADVGVTDATSEAIATRGERLALTHARYSRSHAEPAAFHVEYLQIVEIDAGGRVTALTAFDLDDFDAALGELDARYLTGEAAGHAHAWSVIVRTQAGFTQHELPATTPSPVFIDHRPLVTSDAVDIAAHLRTVWDLIPDVRVYIEAVHRLSQLGAVVTQTLKGTSQEGFDAEWRMINVFAVEGDLISRCETFDEADLDAALARFEELHPPQARSLDNAANQVGKRFLAHFAAREWDAMAELLADDYYHDDHRRVVNAGIRRGRDAGIANMRAVADLGIANVELAAVATRGERLVLVRSIFSFRDHDSEAFRNEQLDVGEINADGRLVANVSFDADDIDGAFAELDARYLAGEAADRARTWSVITGGYASMSRRQLPALTSDCVTIDHRRGAAFAPGELPAYVHAGWDIDLAVQVYARVVHRLSDLGAVCSYVALGFSRDGVNAEWHEIAVTTVEGELINRCEIFDEADLDAAIAQFEQLHLPSGADFAKPSQPA